MQAVDENPARFGSYVLLRTLGVGGMASVYLAKKEGLGGFEAQVAVKVLRKSILEEDPSVAHSLLDEARLGGLLRHDHIVKTLDCGERGSTIFVAMEYVDGPTVQDLIKAAISGERTIPVEAALEIARQAALGLAAAHKAERPDGSPLRMVHRDIKPSNILLTRQGLAKVADFGVARADSNLKRTIHSGIIKGTVAYMSPEQAWGEPELDGRSDLFSLCIVLYEMLSLRRLYAGHTVERLIRDAQDCKYGDLWSAMPSHDLREELTALLERGLAKSRDDRFKDAEELAAAFDGLLDKLPRPRLAALIREVTPLLEESAKPLPAGAAPLEARDGSAEPLGAQVSGPSSANSSWASQSLAKGRRREGAAEFAPEQSPSRGDAPSSEARPVSLRHTWRLAALGGGVVIILLAAWGVLHLEAPGTVQSAPPAAPTIGMAASQEAPNAEPQPTNAAGLGVSSEDGATPAARAVPGASEPSEQRATDSRPPPPAEGVSAAPKHMRRLAADAPVPATPRPLIETAAKGRFSVRALHAGQILVDGAQQGVQTIEGLELPVGAHTLLIRWPERNKTLERSVEIREGRSLGCFGDPSAAQILCQ